MFIVVVIVVVVVLACVCARYASLKADLSVTLDEDAEGKRGGSDAVAFGAPPRPEISSSQDGSGGNQGWAGVKTIADLLAAGRESPGGIFSDTEGATEGAFGAGEGEGAGEGRRKEKEVFLWRCSTAQEERDQLVSFVSLGCFDPSARLQVGTYGSIRGYSRTSAYHGTTLEMEEVSTVIDGLKVCARIDL